MASGGGFFTPKVLSARDTLNFDDDINCSRIAKKVPTVSMPKVSEQSSSRSSSNTTEHVRPQRSDLDVVEKIFARASVPNMNIEPVFEKIPTPSQSFHRIESKPSCAVGTLRVDPKRSKRSRNEGKYDSKKIKITNLTSSEQTASDEDEHLYGSSSADTNANFKLEVCENRHTEDMLPGHSLLGIQKSKEVPTTGVENKQSQIHSSSKDLPLPNFGHDQKTCIGNGGKPTIKDDTAKPAESHVTKARLIRNATDKENAIFFIENEEIKLIKMVDTLNAMKSGDIRSELLEQYRLEKDIEQKRNSILANKKGIINYDAQMALKAPHHSEANKPRNATNNEKKNNRLAHPEQNNARPEQKNAHSEQKKENTNNLSDRHRHIEKKQPGKHQPLGAIVSTSTVHFKYADHGDNWCKYCDKMFPLLTDLLKHLHIEHKDASESSKPFERPWAFKPNEKTPPATNLKIAAIQGVEFLIPSKAFFCDLCKRFFGDDVAAKMHLETESHNNRYKMHIKDNSGYEKYIQKKREACLEKKKAEIEQNVKSLMRNAFIEAPKSPSELLAKASETLSPELESNEGPLSNFEEQCLQFNSSSIRNQNVIDPSLSNVQQQISVAEERPSNEDLPVPVHKIKREVDIDNSGELNLAIGNVQSLIGQVEIKKELFPEDFCGENNLSIQNTNFDQAVESIDSSHWANESGVVVNETDNYHAYNEFRVVKQEHNDREENGEMLQPLVKQVIKTENLGW